MARWHPHASLPGLKAMVTIAGGGLAGLSLAAGLRLRGIPVEVHEAGSYPRHRVCGEFISGLGQHILERLGLKQLLIECGAREVKSVLFCTQRMAAPVRRLPQAGTSNETS